MWIPRFVAAIRDAAADPLQVGRARQTVGVVTLTLAISLIETGELAAQEKAFGDTSGGSDTRAASSESGSHLRSPDEVLFGTSVAVGSRQSGWLGRTPGRNLFLSSVRLGWRLGGSERSSFGYFTELVPLAVVTRNPTTVLPLATCTQKYPEWRDRVSVPVIDYFERCSTRRANVWGAGVTPLGISGRIGRASGAALVTELSVGMIVFNKTMPYPNATRLNYNIAAGSSLEIPVRPRSYMSVGYRFHHLSNGGAGDFNPGVAAHAIRLGWGTRSR